MPTLPVRSRLVAMARKLVERLGQQILWIPEGESARTIWAIVRVEEQIDSRVVADGEEAVMRGYILVANDETEGITVLSPEGDVAKIDGVPWSADGWGKKQFGLQAVRLVRVAEITKGNRERIEEDL
jgi:hypothetical protein